MVVKSDGTKWACQSCLKGHRVSGCTHTDRELQLVPKKGRPVTQCQHCRLERKKRSAHVSCHCGETDKQPHHPKEKCIHLREAEERAKAGFHDAGLPEEKDVAHLAAVHAEQGCCCSHGGKCSCTMLKKEPANDGLPHGPAVKPRLSPTHSDGSITVFHNGHHKPVHRKNHAAHECGQPYRMPLPRANTDHSLQKAARRSVDSLALDSNMTFSAASFATQPLPLFSAERRLSKSEHPSPKLNDNHCLAMSDTNIANLDFSSLGQVQTNQSSSSDQFVYTPMEPLSALADEGYNPWSALPSGDSISMPNNNPFSVWPTNNDVSMAQPALTAASSGTQSEIDEIPVMDEYPFGMPSIQEDPSFNNFIGPQCPGSPNTNRRSLPPSFFSPADFMPGDWANLNEEFPSIIDGKPRSSENTPSNFDDSWQMAHLPSMANVSHRNFTTGGLPIAGRPASQSVGPSSAPSTDVMHQLFPDMDSMFTDGTSPIANNKGMSATSAPPMDFSSNENTATMNAAFTSQAWSDGSMSVPADAYATTSAYEMGQEFSASTPDFSGNWTQ